MSNTHDGFRQVREALQDQQTDQYHGCFTGDCLHDSVHDCIKAIASYFEERAKESTSALATLARLEAEHAEREGEIKSLEESEKELYAALCQIAKALRLEVWSYEELVEKVSDLLAERDRLAARCKAMEEVVERIDQTLRVPAAEYVPAIGDVFTIIDEWRAADVLREGRLAATPVESVSFGNEP